MLFEGNDGVDITAGPLRLRVGNVPLFRRDGDALRQGVRVAISGDVEADTRLSIGAGDTVHDERLIAPGDINRPVVLFVPEVADETPFELRATVAGLELVTETVQVQKERNGPSTSSTTRITTSATPTRRRPSSTVRSASSIAPST